MQTQDTYLAGGWRDRMASLLSGRANMENLQRQIHDLLPCDVFRSQLEREMLRSDRTDTPLTLLMFDLCSYRRGRRRQLTHILRLAKVVCECTRRTDMKGWFQDSKGLRIALMMHNTSFIKAERILSCVRERFEENLKHERHASQVRVSCDVYGYPTDRPADSDKHEQLFLFDDESLMDSNPIHSEVGKAELGGSPRKERRNASNLRAPEALVPGNPSPPSIDELLAPPLPAWKRTMDLIVSTVLLLLLSPLLLVIALGIKLTSRGPVIYKQKRIGFGGKEFLLWKFRSMRVNSNPSEHKKYLSTLINDNDEKPMKKLDPVNPAITSIGHILRITCLDELPQLVNVLAGDMSLIGPRPCLPYEAEEYLLWHHRRFDVMPGITGLWQVSGKNRTTFRQMIRLDICYARHRCFWLDIKILFQTIPAILAEIRGGMGRHVRPGPPGSGIEVRDAQKA